MSNPDLSNVFNNLREVFGTDTASGYGVNTYGKAVQTKTFTNLIGIGLDANQLGTMRSQSHHPSDVYAIVLKNNELLRRERIIEARGTLGGRKTSYYEYVTSNIFGTDPDSPQNTSLNTLSATNLGMSLYYVYILTKNSPPSAVPMILNSDQPYHVFHAIEAYPLATLSGRGMFKKYGLDLPAGTLVRASYSNPSNKTGLKITEIIEDSAVFTQIVCSAMSNVTPQSCNCFIPDAQLGGVQHASGDAMGSEAGVRAININGSVIYPYREGATVDLVVFYHGVGYGDQRFVLNYIKKMPVKNTMFLVPNGNSANWKSVEPVISSLKDKYGVTIKSKKLAGWSGGSKGFMKAINYTGNLKEYWSAKVLSDPSPERGAFGSDLSNIPSDVYMEYNPSNWAGSSLPSDFEDRVIELAQKIDLSGEAVLVRSSRNNHNDILVSTLQLLNI